MNIRIHIEAAIRLAGTESKLGQLTGYSQHAIWKAKTNGRVSPQMALAIHRALQGRIPASVLRPDLWPTNQHVPIEPLRPV
jgi:DNA-binding transcriptional regulator YdaS (Cro superfamily)